MSLASVGGRWQNQGMRKFARFVALMVAALALSGCADTSGPVEPTASVNPVTEESITETVESTQNEQAADSESSKACAGLPERQNRPNHVDDRVHGYWYSELRDIGPIEHATGETTFDDEGQPVSYVAAAGDTMFGIAVRFCLGNDYPYLEQINAIRRGETGELLNLLNGPTMEVYPGDTINLNPYTIATVGDENGEVRNNNLDFHIPQQR